jgi:hypothetical protein
MRGGACKLQIPRLAVLTRDDKFFWDGEDINTARSCFERLRLARISITLPSHIQVDADGYDAHSVIATTPASEFIGTMFSAQKSV